MCPPGRTRALLKWISQIKHLAGFVNLQEKLKLNELINLQSDRETVIVNVNETWSNYDATLAESIMNAHCTHMIKWPLKDRREANAAAVAVAIVGSTAPSISIDRYAKMWYKGVSFTAEQCALVYLVDAAGTRTTTDTFLDMSQDFTLNVFYKLVHKYTCHELGVGR